MFKSHADILLHITLDGEASHWTVLQVMGKCTSERAITKLRERARVHNMMAGQSCSYCPKNMPQDDLVTSLMNKLSMNLIQVRRMLLL